MSEWISYKKSLKTKEEWEIYDLLKKGLQPHDSFTKKLIPCPKSLHEYYHLLDDELIIAVQRGLFLFNQLDSEKIEETISQNGFILVHEKSWLVDRLDRLTDTYIISDEYFDKLRQKDGQYRITSKEIAFLKEHLSKLTKEQDSVLERIAKVFESDSDLNSWQNLVQISSEEEKEKFSEALQNVTFLEDDFNKIVSSQLKKDKTIGRPKDHSPDKSDNYEYCFQNKGAKWCVKFAGQDRYVDHVDGFYYIALLLERPNKTIKTSELYYAIRGMDLEASSIDDLDKEEGLASSFPEEQSIKVTKNIYSRIDTAYKALRKVEKDGHLTGLASYLSNHIRRAQRNLCFVQETGENINWEIIL